MASVVGALPEQLEPVKPNASIKQRLLAEAATDIPSGRNISNPAGVDRSSQAWRWAAVGLAAGFVIAAFAGVLAWAVYLNRELDERDERLARTTDAIEAIVNSDQILTMEGTDAAPDVHAALVVSESAGEVLVLANNVPEPAEGSGYHLWLFVDDAPTAGGVLVPDENGRVSVRLKADLDEFDRMEVDLQPLGSEAPGGTTVIEGNLG